MTASKTEKNYALVANSANKRLVSALEAGDASAVIRFPQIQTEKKTLNEKSAAFFRDLRAFDWLVFFDVFAVDYFLETLEETGTDFFELDAVRVCALGEAVADRLRFVQLHADVIPNSMETAAIVAALSGYIGENEIAGKRFLVVKRQAAENELKIELSEKAAIVAEVEIYSAKISESGARARLKALLKGGAIDEFVFTAPTDLISLKEFSPDAPLAEILSETKISATDEVTFQALREQNLEPRYFRLK